MAARKLCQHTYCNNTFSYVCLGYFFRSVYGLSALYLIRHEQTDCVNVRTSSKLRALEIQILKP